MFNCFDFYTIRVILITYHNCFSIFFKIDFTAKNIDYHFKENKMKKLFTIFLMVLLNYSLFYSQECGKLSKRTVIQFEDPITNPPVPVNSADSISNYINLLKIPSAITNYLTKSDPTFNCYSFLSTALLKDINETNYQAYANFPNTVPDTISAADYFLEIGITGNGVNYTASVNLGLASTKEIVKGPLSISFSNGFDPAAIGQQCASQFSPLNSAIADFEMNKRNSGAPYAIEPTITMKAGRTSLDFNEVTTVTITITDYDGTPLQGRNMSLSVDEGGSLDKYSITTDSQGQDVVLFTAGSEPVIAVIQGTFNYTEPTGKSKNANVEPLGISIKKPDNTWYAEGTFESRSYSKNSTSSSLMNSTEGTSNEIEKVYFSAWVKELTLPVPVSNTFQMEPNPVQLKFKAQRDEVSNSSEWYYNQFGGFINKSTGTVHANDHKGTAPTLKLNIGLYDFGFGISDIDGDQSGRYSEDEDTWNIVEGHKRTSGSSEPSPTTHFSAHVQGRKYDTTYTTSERNDEIGETTVDFNKQTFYWQNKVMKLNYQDNYSSTTYKEYDGFTVNDKSNTDSYVKVFMYYNDDNTGVDNKNNISNPKEFRLEQNYPNPFNPVTHIQYSLPKACKVTGEVFDLLGRKIKTWVVDRNPGTYAFEFSIGSSDGSNFPSGIYFYSITAKPYDNTSEFKSIKKMVLMK